MRTLRLMTVGLAVAATTTAALAAPSTAGKPDPLPSTGTAQIFMVNPVQSSGDQSLSDDKDADSPALAAQYTTAAAAQPRRLRHPVRCLGAREEHHRRTRHQRQQHLPVHP